jgi:cytochrome c biogenesis protein
MRFAVSLLTVLAIASVAGTVVRQGEPYANYLNQFGPFWFRAFEAIGLYAVYTASWFVAILAFLVASVAVCIWRNAPWMVRDMRSFREGKREDSLRLLPHHAELAVEGDAAQAAERAAAYLRRQGFKVKAQDGRIAAKAGSANRLGYLLAHGAIVAICIGGLLDSNLPLKARLAFGDKRPVEPNVLLSQVPPSGRLAPDNPSFRGNTFVPEGQSSDVAVLNIGDGVLVQELPFRLELKKFHIEHYSSGQPKLFASDVLVTDKASGESFEARIEVNKPLVHRGIAVYQASFDDGGTRMELAGHHLLAPRAKSLAFDGRVGETLELKYDGRSYRVELASFRAFNIEDVGGDAKRPQFRNVGPSFGYKLRDAAGQAREYHNYMLPIDIEGRWMMLTGMRETPNEQFRYLRLPLDEEARLDGFWLLRAALLDEAARPEIARRFARGAGESLSPPMRERLAESAERVLDTFTQGGYQAVAEFIERAVPEAEREQAADVYLRVLQGVAWDAWQYARGKEGLPALEATPERSRFVQDALNALSDSYHYGVPVYLALARFDEVKASVFQMTRSPGQGIVYLGCALLVLGVFVMLYVRERRAWILPRPGASALFGMQCNRRTLDFDREFARHRDALQRVLKHGTG